MAKIVIISCGVIGSMIAYHLAQAGDTSDVSWSSAIRPTNSAAARGIRQLYTIPENIRMSQYGHALHGSLAETRIRVYDCSIARRDGDN